MSDLEDLLPPVIPLHERRQVPAWGFNDIARWRADERQPYLAKLECAQNLYMIFSPSFPSPQRTWVQVAKPARSANVLFYHGCTLPALKDHMPMSQNAAELADSFYLGDADPQWKEYFGRLGDALSGPNFQRTVHPYLYCPAITGRPGRSTLAFYLEDKELRKGLWKLFTLAAKQKALDENHIVCVPLYDPQ